MNPNCEQPPLLPPTRLFALGGRFFLKPHKIESIFNFNQSLLCLFTVLCLILEDGELSFLRLMDRRSTKADNIGQCYMEYCDGFQLAEGTIKHYLYYLDSESTARCEDSVVKYRNKQS